MLTVDFEVAFLERSRLNGLPFFALGLELEVLLILRGQLRWRTSILCDG